MKQIEQQEKKTKKKQSYTHIETDDTHTYIYEKQDERKVTTDVYACEKKNVHTHTVSVGEESLLPHC